MPNSDEIIQATLKVMCERTESQVQRSAYFMLLLILLYDYLLLQPSVRVTDPQFENQSCILFNINVRNTVNVIFCRHLAETNVCEW
jgi:hypothetical protein